MTTATTKRPMSEQARAAKAIRSVLKGAFPTVKFSVTSEGFAGGNAVRVQWTDGPTTDQVDALVNPYQEGRFDGMTDMYEYTNRNAELPQAKYVSTSRIYSSEARREAMEHVNAYYGSEMVWDEPRNWIAAGTDSWVDGGGFYASTLIHQYSHKRTMVCSSCHEHAHISDDFCGQCGEKLNA